MRFSIIKTLAMKHILVPTDFSSCANNAIDFAVQTAKLSNGDVTLLHVFEMDGDLYTDYMGVNKEFNDALLVDIRNKLQQQKDKIEDTEGVRVNTQLIKGYLKDSILLSITERHADLLVMGTLGASGIKEKLWGSKTASIINNTPIPLMVIPNEYVWNQPKKILLASNHFEKEPKILEAVFHLAGLFDAEIEVAIFTDEDDDKAISFVEHTRTTPQYEKALQEVFKIQNIKATHLYGKLFEDTLQEYIQQNDIDILSMITYHRNFWNQIFHPSITKRMSYHTKVPLLVIPLK